MSNSLQMGKPSRHVTSQLAKSKFHGFPGLLKLVFKDFPEYKQFTNMVAWGQAQMQYLWL